MRARCNAEDEDLPHRHLLISRGISPKFSFVCASQCKAYDYLVSLGNHILNGEMKVGKRTVDLALMLFRVLEAPYILAKAVTDPVSGVELVHYVNEGLPLVLLLKLTAHERLVFLC